ncbi:MAG: citrate transporter family protein [Solimicrobium sp.]|jgi:H+/gluconate symporter-like permease|nr:citrate transporter family protein [Solimicrobium sp.]
MAFLVVLTALILLMFIAYRGFSVILFAPIVAMLAVFVTDPSMVAPVFSSVFMEEMVLFLKLYFPVFVLGAIFGKVIELSGFSKAIVSSIIRFLGSERTILSIVLVCAVLTYGGVSLFVVVFAVYPFAAEMFRQGNIPKRLIPGTIALGAFSFTMDSLPGTPQIQNIIPTTFFNTTTWAAPWLGFLGSAFILMVGLAYLEWRRKSAFSNNEGYGEHHLNEPEPLVQEKLVNPFIALLPLVLVGVLNKVFTHWIPQLYGTATSFQLASSPKLIATDITKVAAIWAVEAALLIGILSVLLLAFRPVCQQFAEGSKTAIAGALLAATNTATEYGFGAVIASLPGFLIIGNALKNIPNPLINEALTVTSMAGITGSASGGLSIALAAMSDTFIQGAHAAHIPLEVMHRVASMASGGMDTLPHNGAVITLLAVTGLTHRVAYGDVFAITCIKTLAVFFVIAVFYLTGIR